MCITNARKQIAKPIRNLLHHPKTPLSIIQYFFEYYY